MRTHAGTSSCTGPRTRRCAGPSTRRRAGVSRRTGTWHAGTSRPPGTWTRSPPGTWAGSPGPGWPAGPKPAGPSRAGRAAPTGSTTVVGDAVARTTERATTAPARAAATTQPAPRLMSAFRMVSPRRCRSGCPAAGTVIGEVTLGDGGSGGSGPAECSCPSTSAHLTAGPAEAAAAVVVHVVVLWLGWITLVGIIIGGGGQGAAGIACEFSVNIQAGSPSRRPRQVTE
jgi:hypothetical protein